MARRASIAKSHNLWRFTYYKIELLEWSRISQMWETKVRYSFTHGGATKKGQKWMATRWQK